MLKSKVDKTVFRNDELNIYIASFIVAFYIFFGYLFPKQIQYSMLVISNVMLIVLAYNNQILISKRYHKIAIILSILTFFFIINIIVSSHTYTTFKIIISWISIINISTLIVFFPDFTKHQIKFYLFFSVIHVFFTLIGVVFDDLYRQILLKYLPNHVSDVYDVFIRAGSYHGITEQTGRNAYYISIGIAIFITTLLSNKIFSKKNILMTVFLMIYYSTLLLTGRRGSLLANIVSFLVIFIFLSIKEKISLKKVIILPIVIVVVFSFLILLFVPETANIFDRIFNLNGYDISTGRFNLFNKAIRQWKDSPVFGTGVGSFNLNHGISTHNLYLQILSEMGLLGLGAFVFFVFKQYIFSVKKLLSVHTTKTNNLMLFSVYIQSFFIIYFFFESPITELYFLMPWLLSITISHIVETGKSSDNKILSIERRKFLID